MTFEEMKQLKNDLKLVLIVVDGVDGIGKESFSDFLVSYLRLTRDNELVKNDYEINYSDSYDPIKIFNKESKESISVMTEVMNNKNIVIEKKSFPNYETDTGRKIKTLLYGNQTDETTKELEKLFNINIVNEMSSYIDILKNRASKDITTILVCDRYISSNLIYMSSRKDKETAVEFIKPYAVNIPFPNIMIIGVPDKYDLNEYFETLKNRGNLDKFESDKEFLMNVMTNYRLMAYHGFSIHKIFGCDLDYDFIDEECEFYRFGLKWWNFDNTNNWLGGLTNSIRKHLLNSDNDK